MTCHEARQAFSALVDEVIGPDEGAPLQAHLDACPECRAELQRFRRSVALMRERGPVRAPTGFVDRVRAAARPEPWPRRIARRLFVPVRVKVPLEAAVVVLLAFGAVYFVQRSPELQQAGRLESRESLVLDEPAPAASRTRPDRPLEGRRAAQAPAAESPGAKAPEAKARADKAPTTEAEAPVAKTPALKSEAPSRDLRDDAASKLARAPADSDALAAAEASGRLTVASREGAVQAIRETLARLGGTIVSRRDEPGETLLEVRVPGPTWPALRREIERLGRFQAEHEPATPPGTLRLTLRLVPSEGGFSLGGGIRPPSESSPQE